jgi:hypothetical protein
MYGYALIYTDSKLKTSVEFGVFTWPRDHEVRIISFG